jgi:VCBS repeat protein
MNVFASSVVVAAALGLAVTGQPAGAAGLDARTAIDAPAVRFITPDVADPGGILSQHADTGDFDGDGKLDAVFVNQGPSNVFGPGIGVALGNGAGKLGATVTTDLGNGWGACDLAVANWNGDEMDDLVVSACTTGGSGPLIALVATGAGHFTQTQTWAGTNQQIAAGDFNNDDVADFVTSRRGSALVTTYLGKGDGTFKDPISVTPDFDSYDLEAGDVNNDGNLDLIGAAGGPIWVMLGKGDGTFGNEIFHGSQVLSGIELAVADFDGDGFLDVATVDASGGHIGIGIGAGNGSFVDGDQIVTGSRQVTWITPGRFTSDAKADLVVGLDNDSTASGLYAGRGNGHFRPPTHWVLGADGLTSADFNGDGLDDIVSLVGEGKAYLGIATGKGFRAARLTPGPNSADLVDLNGDQLLDKVSGVTSFTNGNLQSEVIAQLGKGNGRFGKPIVSKVRNETASSGVGDIDIADLNEDGVPDVVGGFDNFQPSPNNLFWMVGKGDGSFGPATLSDTGDFNADVDAIAAADVNSDGHADIIANDLAHMVARLGNGKAKFGAPIASGVGSGANRAVLVDDFTGDGIADVVTTARTGNEDFGHGQIRLQQGSNTGTFALVQTQDVDSNLSSGAKADLNKDGRPDVVTAGSRGFNGGRNALWVLLTTPSGMLGTPTPYAGPTGQVDSADVDLDGDLDIATSGNATIDFYLNDGSGVFPRFESILAAGGLGAMGRITADRAPDAIAGGPFGEFAVHINAR